MGGKQNEREERYIDDICGKRKDGGGGGGYMEINRGRRELRRRGEKDERAGRGRKIITVKR